MDLQLGHAALSQLAQIFNAKEVFCSAVRKAMSAKQGRSLVKQHFVRDQTDAAVLLNLMRLFAISVLDLTEADKSGPAQ